MIRLAMSTMRRFLTWGLIAAVAAVALAAGIDALRGGAGAENLAATGGEPPATAEPAEQHDDPFVAARAELQAAGVPEGRLTHAGGGCRNQVVTMPDLRQDGPPLGYAGICRYHAVFGGLVDTADALRSPDWGLRVECKGGRLFLWRDIFDNPKPELNARARGCGAAWKPNGTITFIRDGEVRHFVRCPGDAFGAIPLRCSTIVLSRADLDRRLALAHGNGIAWSPDERWIAEATEGGIVVFRTNGETPELIRIPVVASDLLWEDVP